MQSHINEPTNQGEHVTIDQVGESAPAGHYNDCDIADEIADHMQEVYEVVDACVEHFVHRPREIKTIHGANGESDSTSKAANTEPLLMDIESERSPHHTGSSLYMVDENQLDRVEDIPEARA